MSDLLAPLLAVMDNEVDTFWCFVGYMNMVVSGVCGRGRGGEWGVWQGHGGEWGVWQGAWW